MSGYLDINLNAFVECDVVGACISGENVSAGKGAMTGHSEFVKYFLSDGICKFGVKKLPQHIMRRGSSSPATCQIRTDDPEITSHVLWPTELRWRYQAHYRGYRQRMSRYRSGMSEAFSSAFSTVERNEPIMRPAYGDVERGVSVSCDCFIRP